MYCGTCTVQMYTTRAKFITEHKNNIWHELYKRDGLVIQCKNEVRNTGMNDLVVVARLWDEAALSWRGIHTIHRWIQYKNQLTENESFNGIVFTENTASLVICTWLRVRT